MNWKPLTSLDQLDELSTESMDQTVLIFKHSTRCIISRMVLRQFENEFNQDSAIATYFLDLLQHRDVSNAVAEKFGVQHQSPQLILLKDGIAVFNASHESITVDDLEKFI